MISFRNVTKRYGDFKAVDNLSVDIESFELFVIIGPSGSGKSTTMKMINRLIDISEGDIFIDDMNVKDIDSVKLRRSMGYVIQDIGLMPHMTIGENISLVNRLKGMKRDDNRIDELLDLVRMPPEDFRGRYPEELSGGQQQRIGVIRALYSDPNIILMDEPFSALDPVTKLQLQDEFLRVQKEIKKTIVFVTHDIDEALKLGDRVLLMREGKIEQLGTPRELLFEPKNEFVSNFIGKDRQRRFAIQNFNIDTWIDKSYPTIETIEKDRETIMKIFKKYQMKQLPFVKNGEVYGVLNLYDGLDGTFEVQDSYVLIDYTLELDDIIKQVNEDYSKLPIVVKDGKYLGVLDNRHLISMLTAEKVGGGA